MLNQLFSLSSFFFLLSFSVDRSFNFLNNEIKFSNRFSSAFQNSTSKTSGWPLVWNDAGQRPTRQTLSIEAKGNPYAPLQNPIPFQSMRLWEQQLLRGEEWWPENSGRWCLLIWSMYSHSHYPRTESQLTISEKEIMGGSWRTGLEKWVCMISRRITETIKIGIHRAERQLSG